MPDREHLKLHEQFVALLGIKLHAENQRHTSISF